MFKKSVTLLLPLLLMISTISFAKNQVEVRITKLQSYGPGIQACKVYVSVKNHSKWNIQSLYFNLVLNDDAGDKLQSAPVIADSLQKNKPKLVWTQLNDYCRNISEDKLETDVVTCKYGDFSGFNCPLTVSLNRLGAKSKISKKPFHFVTEYDFAVKTSNNPKLKKELSMAQGAQIAIDNVWIWNHDSSDYENGGNLYLMSDASLGVSTEITCSVSPEDGDKFMEKNLRIKAKVTGRIESYSSTYGLSIEPCEITELKLVK